MSLSAFPVHVVNVVSLKPDFPRDSLLLLFPLCHVGGQIEGKRSSAEALVPSWRPITPPPALPSPGDRAPCCLA